MYIYIYILYVYIYIYTCIYGNKKKTLKASQVKKPEVSAMKMCFLCSMCLIFLGGYALFADITVGSDCTDLLMDFLPCNMWKTHSP